MEEEVKEKEYFCRKCKERFSSLILYCPKCHCPDALIKDVFSFKCGYDRALREMINIMLDKKGEFRRLGTW